MFKNKKRLFLIIIYLFIYINKEISKETNNNIDILSYYTFEKILILFYKAFINDFLINILPFISFSKIII